MSDITELFSRDPLSLSDQDIDAIIEEMRSKRHLYNANPAAVAGKAKLTEKEKSLSSLNIEIKL
jgi:hypothetical protein